MSFTLEDLDKALDHKNILVSAYGDIGVTVFVKRHREVIINSIRYTINWYKDQCYLNTGDLIIPFSFVKQNDTWPNYAKMNLRFYDEAGNTCCILKIEDYTYD